jgi:ParB family chromosome partitioning protein
MRLQRVSVSAFSWRCAAESERRAGLSVTGRRSRERLSAARRGESDMASVQKIKLSPSRDIPFNKLVLSQSNVRRVKAGISIEQLAESIAQRTLLQSLSVRAVVDADGQETGMFEVPAGGRRYRALELLVKQKRMAKTQPVPCVIRDGGIAEDDSLAENDERVGLHPLDQFRAFKLLHDGGMSEEDIAARHFISPAIVKQRLRLASVSPKLHEVYAEDGMTLEQLMAFSVTADQTRQAQVWDNASRSGNDEPYQIRRILTENTVRASDRRARFVGLDAYKQAGGAVLRDLFEHDDGGWLQDVPLLDRLVTEKLMAQAETIAAEGWKWIAAAVDFPYGHTHSLRELKGEPVDLTQEERVALDALNAEYAKIEEDYREADELPDEIDQRLGEIEAARSVLEARSLVYEPAEIARAGAFVSIDAQGLLSIARGHVRREDEAPVAVEPESDAQGDEETNDEPTTDGLAQRAVITVGGTSTEPVEEEDDGTVKPLPDRLITELTAHRTLALRNALANEPAVAFRAVLYNFVLATFYRFASSSGCLEIAIRTPAFPAQAPGLKESVSAEAIDGRHEGWKARLPKDEADLWNVLTAFDRKEQAALFAHCASFAVNALHEPANRYNEGRVSAHAIRRRLEHANVLARSVGLDMAALGWRPTVDNYLGRVTKPRILQAVREAKGEQSVQLIDHLKKGDMAREAERLLEGTGWLPEPLRLGDLGAVGEPAADPEALPEFLAGGEDEADTEADDERPHIIAAG